MRRFFVKNIIFVIAVNVLVKPIWVFFIDRNVQNTVPLGEYGTYQALMSLSIIFQTLLDFGITNYNSRTISMNPEKLHTLFPAMLSARLVLMTLYLIIAMTGGIILGYRGWEIWLLFGVLLIQSLNALVSFIRSNVSALHRFKTDGILSIIDRLLMILICSLLFYLPATAGKFKIEWFVIAQIFCYFVAAIIGYTILKRIGKIHFRLSFDVKEILKIMKQSLPYAILIFQMSIYIRSDAMMIERIGTNGKQQADIWAAGFRLLDVCNMFGLMFATMLLPVFGRMLSQKQDVHPIIKICVNILLPMSIMVAVASAFFAPNIMNLLYKGYSRNLNLATDYETVFKFLMASFPAWCIMYIYSTLLTANGSLKILNYIALLGVIVNLSFNLYLIPKYGAGGGAFTSFFTQTLLSSLFILYASKHFKFPINIKWILAHLCFIGICIVVAYTVINYFNYNWIIQLSIFGLISVLLMFILNFISVSGIKQLVKKQ